MKIGDKVRFLSEVGGGVVTGFQGKNIVLVEDADGFDIPMPINECVVIETDDYNIPTPAAKAAAKKKREEEQQLRTAATAARSSAGVSGFRASNGPFGETADICLSSARDERRRYPECFSGFCSGGYQGCQHYTFRDIFGER